MSQAPLRPDAATPISQVSEGELLAWITARVPDVRHDGATILGIGDDAAVLRFGGDAVVTTDTLVHGPDFRMAWSDASSLGWKAAAVNLADVAAMGARPTALLIALTLPADLPLGWVGDFYDGLVSACRWFGDDIQVVGGDVTVSPTLTIAVTALGDLRGAGPVLRSGARAGDVLALAGEQGPAARGLQVLFARFRDAEGRPVAVDDALLTEAERFDVGRQLRPEPPVRLGEQAAAGGAHALMDVSDGLVMDARRMARASGVRIDIDAAALGADPAAALAGGEDHTLLAAFPAGRELPAGFRRIGRVLASPVGDVTVDGAVYDARGGWDPYQDWDAAQG
ncbi:MULTISPECIES: thiamine-phosphate kinase [Microbacterium]|uniref:thiamine-phosphate kinase n=1 Tax=Microbacterium TaxID=33882 RepID=UPI001E2A65A5|nr:thiamine-phosphate kinase [Microbacterium nymphoidis]MCD2497113.1 thiamine-phosphate kinase [Microbacterium nymphoidis]